MEKEKTLKLALCLRETREYLGLSQQKVAEYVGLPSSSISEIESGKRKVDDLELQKFSQLFKYPVSYFFGGEIIDDKTVHILARTSQDLTEVDKQQVVKFAHFLKNLGNGNFPKREG
ncbi:helix-turn-helix domain-containing protein [Peribacillus simplex]|uniref:helix-turn-helix domain-containing protein n=1 Tax=Peribacillus simplex TaxID=1478 RepID=UPI001921CA73|nr:helix-turn-helix domain-containing protein [Peribacillus simplex]MBD8591210.1 helix-turn-helix domain-containing protein [Peribacillus simplex]